uniref:GIY-YIG domain-containing protein n=1 Tax=viral metagenome TaxID=1070528 RepID=A0A6C0CHI4_9ZZZZ
MDYGKSKIYKLECNDGFYYYGATIQPLDTRLRGHKFASKKQSYRVYKHINEIGWDKVKITLVEDYPCKCKEELNKRESEFIYGARKDEKCLNTILSYATEEQKTETREKYLETYKRPLTEQRIEYTHNYNKKYRELKGDELKKKKSEYYYSKKEKCDKKNMENYYKNKEEILRKKREKYHAKKNTEDNNGKTKV